VLEAGLGSLTVGLIPPALDQVLIGALDRSRNPAVKMAILLGMNETVFPARPSNRSLLSDGDRAELEKCQFFLHDGARHQLAREQHYAYTACTRAQHRLVLTSALHDINGAPLNAYPFL